MVLTTSALAATALLHHSSGIVSIGSIFVETGLAVLLSNVLWLVTRKTGDTSFPASDTLILAILPWWRHFNGRIAVLWPRLLHLSPSTSEKLNGPLGPNFIKVCDIAAGLLLWNLATWISELKSQNKNLSAASKKASSPVFLSWKKPVVSIPSIAAFCLFTGVVNVVLSLWSTISKSQVAHKGVLNIVRQQKSAYTLTAGEKLSWFVWALANAICEEVSSRGIWRSAFAIALRQDRPETSASSALYKDPSIQLHSNLLQALVFGLWHYDGIPSGWTGVTLTFIYGAILGWMADKSGGTLWLPVVTHTVADYYIFTTIAQAKGAKAQD